MARSIKNQWKPNIPPFPLIPNRATTTKLAKKLEKTSKSNENHVQPVGCWEGKKWRYCSGSSWSYLIMFKFVSQLCEEGNISSFLGHLRTADHSCLPSAGKKSTGVTLSKIIPKSHISHGVLGLFFLMSRYAGITFYYSEVCWWGSTVKASPILLTWKCSSHHIGMHFFDIATSKSAPTLSVFSIFDLQICFAPQRRALFHLSSGQLAPHPPL